MDLLGGVSGVPQGRAVGVVLEPDDLVGAVRVDQLFISPDHEAEGIGRQLLEFAEGYAIWKEAEALQVVVEGDNERALSFYRGRGFTPVGSDLLELLLPQR